jgi:hypothetical protein
MTVHKGWKVTIEPTDVAGIEWEAHRYGGPQIITGDCLYTPIFDVRDITRWNAFLNFAHTYERTIWQIARDHGEAPDTYYAPVGYVIDFASEEEALLYKLKHE